MEVGKLQIELTPYEAMCIYKFLSEWEEDFKRQPQLASFYKVYNNYRKEVVEKITTDQLQEAIIETETNQALGYDPKSGRNNQH